MPHETGLITTIVGGLVLAFVFGAIANRFRMPPLVGYLVAGMLVGPYTPGFVADQGLASQLAEIGVILLMFGVGLHFSLRDLMSVRALAIPGAIVQIGFATLLGLGLALAMGWNIGGGLVFGLALSVASTVVLLKALQDRRLVDTERGRIAVGWLIVEDLAMVLALVLIPAFASLSGEAAVEIYDPFVAFVERIVGTDLGVPGVLAITVVKMAAFAGFMLVVGRRVIPAMLHWVAHTGNRELFRLAVLAIALGVALGSAYLFGVSLALGAFFAGMILAESELSQRAAQETLPLRDAFAVLFFVSVGMLFDPTIILRDPLPVLATVLIIVVGKSLAAFAIVTLFRQPISTALVISASLAQIGEFSFILAELGVGLNLLPEAGRDLILAGAILSIMLNPLAFLAADLMRPRLEARALARRGDVDEPIEPALAGGAADTDELSVLEDDEEEAGHREVALHAADDAEVQPTRLSNHAVLVGYGRVGSVIGEGLREENIPFLVIDDADAKVAAAHAAGLEVVAGNAASPQVLRLANVAGARWLLVAIPNSFEAGQVTEQCRKVNPDLHIIVRAHGDEEEGYLRRLGADKVIMGGREIGLGMLAEIEDMLPSAPVTASVAAPEAEEPQGVRLAPAENVIAAAVGGRLAEAPASIVATSPAPVDIEAGTPDTELAAEAPTKSASVAAAEIEVVEPAAPREAVVPEDEDEADFAASVPPDEAEPDVTAEEDEPVLESPYELVPEPVVPSEEPLQAGPLDHSAIILGPPPATPVPERQEERSEADAAVPDEPQPVLPAEPVPPPGPVTNPEPLPQETPQPAEPVAPQPGPAEIPPGPPEAVPPVQVPEVVPPVEPPVTPGRPTTPNVPTAKARRTRRVPS